MTGKNLDSIASEINELAKTHPIGALQEIRKNLKGLERLPTRDIFTSLTTSERWAFHHGGRQELQFNIGIERSGNLDELRYGVAFSLETSRSLPKIDVLIPKVRLFNDFIQLYPEQFAGMRMRHYQEQRSAKYMPTSIPPELVTEGVFIFVGEWQSLKQIDYETLLNCFDKLLPVYQYVESGGSLQPISTITATPFDFQPGLSLRAPSTTASLAARELDINLRHNILQEALYHKLADRYGADNVGVELPSGAGTSVDVVVRDKGQFYFYEIKTAQSPRACLRQALGQILEYSFWPGSQEAIRLVVVGESSLDEEGAEYLRILKKRFSLPVEYEQIVVY
jgi:hypothetical protein